MMPVQSPLYQNKIGPHKGGFEEGCALVEAQQEKRLS